MKSLQSFLRRLSGSFAPSLQERMINLSVSFFLHDFILFLFFVLIILYDASYPFARR